MSYRTLSLLHQKKLLLLIFLAGLAPLPIEAGDANCDDAVNLADIIHIINHIFMDGSPPCDTNGDGELDC